MSRAYRVSVTASERRVVRAEDHVGTTLEILEILPREQMAELLRRELIGRGFADEGGRLVRREGDIVVEVDPAEGCVTARAEVAEEVELTAEGRGYADTDWGEEGRAKAEARIREGLRGQLDAQADRKADEARARATDRLEGALTDLRAELDGAVNRATAEALKQKAAQLGRIKEMTEDPQAGSLTIVVEV